MAYQAPAFDDLPSFDDLPDAAPPKESASPPAWDALPSWDALPDQQRPDAETPLATGVREAAHAAAPAGGGLVAAGIGAAYGAPLGPAGAIAGGIIGMVGGSVATDYIQDKALKALGFNDDAQRAANIEANPKSAFAGGLAPAVATMSPIVAGGKAAQVIQRGVGAGMMGGFEAGQEYINEGHVDPGKAAAAAAVGVVFPSVNRVGAKLVGAGEKLVPGRPNRTANPAADQAHVDAGASQTETVSGEGGVEQQATPATGNTTGNPQSAPERSQRAYPKDNQRQPRQGDMLTEGDMDPATRAALDKSLSENALNNDTQTSTLPGKAPEESLPIATGIEEAGQAQAARPEPGVMAQETKPQPGEPGVPVETGIEAAAKAPPWDALPTAGQTAIETSKANSAKSTLGLKPKSFEELTRQVKGETNPNPTDGQKEAGNYVKARERDFGHEIALEGMKGSERTGVDAEGKPWSSTLPADYGYFRKTIGADKDHVDVYRGESGDKHFIVDQRDATTGKFDEHKVMTGFKDINDARETYLKGFSDDKALARLHDINEVDRDTLTAWLKGASKKKPYGAPVPKEATTPKVVTATVKALRATGDPAYAKVADAIEAMPKEKQVVEATRANAALTNRTGKVPDEPKALRIRAKPPSFKVGDTEVTGRTLADVERKTKSLEANKEAFDKFPPVEGEDKHSLGKRLREAVDHAIYKLKDDPFAYKPRVVPKENVWLRQARDYLKGNPTQAKFDKFISNEKLLRSGKPEDVDLVRGTNRIEADIARSQRSGDDAIANAENENAAKGRFDVPHEEAEGMVEPEPVKSAADLRKLNDKTLDLTKPADATIAAIDTDKISRNIISQADKRKAEALSLVGNKSGKAPGESEGAASEVRKIAIDDPKEIQRILDAANTASKKGKGLDALPAERDPTQPTPKVKDLFEKFMSDESGTLNHQRIANDFKLSARPLRLSMEKYFGTPLGEVGRKVDAVLARSVSTEDSINAEKAHLLDLRYYTWIKAASKTEQVTYQKVLEHIKTDTPWAEAKAKLEAAGIPAEKAGWMANEAKFHRDLYNDIFLEDQKHGANYEYREGYLSHIFKDHKGANDFIEARIKSLGANWYQKERVFDLLDEAMKAGFKMKYDNPIDVIHARWAASIKSNMLVAAARGLHNDGLAFPIKDAPDFAKKSWTFKRNLPDHQQWVFAPGAENLWKNAMEAKGLGELEGPIGGLYRGWMKLKRIWAPIQLAFSAFHELHVAANINPAMNIARALKLAVNDPKSSGRVALDAIKWSLTDPFLSLPVDKIGFGLGKALDGPNGRFSQFAGRKAQHWWTTPTDQLDANGRMWKRLFQEGGISPYQSKEDVIGAKRDFAQALNDKSLKSIPHGLRRGIEKIQEPMFKYQIPALKNVAYMRNVGAAMKMDPELATNAAKRGVVLREIGKNIDDRFGEMFYKGLFWNKYAKDAGIGSMLSLSWNLGQLRQVAGAAKNVAGTAGRALGYQGKPMAEAKFHADDKATFVGSYIGLSMASAGALSYMLTGSLPSGLDYVFPRNGLKNADGSDQRLSTPFNTREPFMLKAHAEQHNSWVGGAMEFLWNKMVLSPLVEIAQNKDFYGNKLYDPSTSWYKKALQTMDSTAGRMFNPISLSGADRAKQLGGGKKEQALAYSGFNPAPKYVNATPLENHINHLFSEEGTPMSRPYQYGEKTGLGRGLVQGVARWAVGDKLQTEARTEARQKLDQAGIKGDLAAANDARRELVEKGGMSARTVTHMRPDQEFQYKFARLPKESQVALAHEMDDAEFNKFVILNTNQGLQKLTKAQLIKERATSSKAH